MRWEGNVNHVPYKGGGPAAMALAQGEVDIFAGGASLLVPQAKAGRVRLLAVTESTRSKQFPELPIVSETISGFEVSNWYGVFGRSAMSNGLVNDINREVNRIMQSADVAASLESHGMSHTALSPVELRALLQKERKRWSETITSLRISAQ